jgi:mono/diheme cytochrome c family protein
MKFRGLLVLILADGLAACGDGGGAPAAAAATGEKSRTIQVVLSGDTRGFIVPCGCTTKQYGGLPRRATYLQGLPALDTLYVDAGGSFHRAFDYDRIKGEYLWRGMSALKIRAANLGASEIAQGLEYLRANASKVPLVSTNISARDGGPPVASPEIRTTVGGAKIVILGVCSAKYAPGPGLKVEDPREALRAPVARFRSEADLLLLLAQAPEEELTALAMAFPELDAVLATGPSQPIPPRLVEGRTVLAGASNKGKFLVTIPWTSSGTPPRWTAGEGKVVELSESYADHPAQVGIVKEYQQALRNAALPPEKTGETAPLLAGLPGDYRYAGTGTCVKCHTPEGEIWKVSKHAHGLETIQAKGFEADPFCVRCHSTGYGGPEGYRSVSETPLLGGVGCESCHGPSQAHATAPLRLRTPARAFDACLKCHDPENSPTFSAAEFWPRIIHGKGRAPAPPGTGGAGPR